MPTNNNNIPCLVFGQRDRNHGAGHPHGLQLVSGSGTGIIMQQRQRQRQRQHQSCEGRGPNWRKGGNHASGAQWQPAPPLHCRTHSVSLRLRLGNWGSPCYDRLMRLLLVVVLVLLLLMVWLGLLQCKAGRAPHPAWQSKRSAGGVRCPALPCQACMVIVGEGGRRVCL
jgi:hypothetical protein